MLLGPIAQEMEGRKFDLRKTGAGCTAYVRETEDGGDEVLTTDAAAARAPKKLDELVVFGRYDDKGETLELVEGMTFREWLHANPIPDYNGDEVSKDAWSGGFAANH